jgi:hypothetical protein
MRKSNSGECDERAGGVASKQMCGAAGVASGPEDIVSGGHRGGISGGRGKGVEDRGTTGDVGGRQRRSGGTEL